MAKPATKQAELELLALEIHQDAAELRPSDRERFIADRTRGNPALRRIVDELAADASMARSFLESSPVPRPATVTPVRPPPVLQPGEQLGDFEILRILGRGGFATVYLARQLSLDREVALKVSADKGKEAKILAHLDHDHIVKVYSQTTDPQRGLRIVCMQYVEGKTLADVMERWAVDPSVRPSGAAIIAYMRTDDEEPSISTTGDLVLGELDYQETALWIGARLADALAYAHERGILHLDVKPNNVLLSKSGRPVLTDFNVSLDHREVAAGGELMLGGTENYMAPEHLALFHATDRNKAIAAIDHRADIYSLGVVLRDLITAALSPARGKAPKPGNSTMALKGGASVKETAYNPVEWGAIDASTRFILEKCLARDPRNRFASAAELATALLGGIELRTIQKSIPRPGVLLRAAIRYPALFLSVCALLPQLAASGLIFASLAAIFPGFFDPADLTDRSLVCLASLAVLQLALFVLWIARLRAVLRPRLPGRHERWRLLKLTSWLFGLMTFLWLPVHLAALGYGHFGTGPIDLYEASRILLGTALLGLGATGCSGGLVKLITLRALYPRFWLGATDIREEAASELAGMSGTLKLFYFLVAWAPLMAASLVYIDPGEPLPRPELAIAALLAMALLGVMLNFTVSHRIAQIVFAFSRRSRTKTQSVRI